MRTERGNEGLDAQFCGGYRWWPGDRCRFFISRCHRICSPAHQVITVVPLSMMLFNETDDLFDELTVCIAETGNVSQRFMTRRGATP